MGELEKRNCMERKKAERTAVFFQDFSRKKVDICRWQKMKHHFLEWAKCHTNRWQKCRHAREQVYELMHGHAFLSRNVETAAFGELFQLLNLQNHVIISLALSLLQMDIDVISWKMFLLSNSNISHTNVYLSEREVVLCCYINIFDIYYFKVSMSKHHTLAHFTGPCVSMSLQWFLRHFGAQHYFKTIIFHLFVLGYNLLLNTLEKHKGKNKLMTFSVSYPVHFH